MRALVTTTINPPTNALLAFAEFVTCNTDWVFIIVGDTRTPHDDYHSLAAGNERFVYLDPDKQADLLPKLSDIIGWRSIQRRNLGFICAYHLGAELVATVDDDNVPLEGWGRDIFVGQDVEYDAYRNKSVDCFDPLSITGYEGVWHRGYPLEYRDRRNDIEFLGKKRKRCLVQADLWNGDPDIDALVRIARAPQVDLSSVPKLYGSAQISPFNSQNTFIHRSAIPHYAVFTGVGRMDDIWGAYALQAVFPNSVLYHRPTVYHARNEQDLVANLEDELLGYRQTGNFIEAGSDFNSLLPEKTQEFWRHYRAAYTDESLKESIKLALADQGH